MQKIQSVEEILADVRKTIGENPKLKSCQLCVWSNEGCTWCQAMDKAIRPYLQTQFCKHYMTNEEALKVMAEQGRQEQQHKYARLFLLMDIMAYLAEGADKVLEDVSNELEQDYKDAKDKSSQAERNHKESKRNRERLHKAYVEMREHMRDSRNAFNNYVQHYFKTIFCDDDGKWNVPELDKNSVNSGVVTAFNKVLVDRTLDNGENAGKIMDYMLSLPGSGILSERDFGKSMVKH